MKIRYFINGILQSESAEDGFVVLVGTEHMSAFKLLSDQEELVSPYVDKKISFPDGDTAWIRISRSKVFDDTRKIMRAYQGLALVEFRAGNAELEIEW